MLESPITDGIMKDIYFFGDSIAYGQWDAEGGWVQRIRASFDRKFLDGGDRVLVYNLGIPGDTAADVLLRIEGEMAARFNPANRNYIVFAVGTNDAHFSTSEQKDRFSQDEFERNIGRLIGVARKFSKDIAFVGLNPIEESKVQPLPWNTEKSYTLARIELFNSIVEKVAKEEGLFFADVWKDWAEVDHTQLLFDGLHPTGDGHRRIVEKINPFFGD
jgi:lysophospholipase L1-like esterase